MAPGPQNCTEVEKDTQKTRFLGAEKLGNTFGGNKKRKISGPPVQETGYSYQIFGPRPLGAVARGDFRHSAKLALL